MARLRIQELLQERGKSRCWLFGQLDMSYQNYRRMLENETKSISKENIEALCQILSCSPNDLISLDEKQEDDEHENTIRRKHKCLSK